MNQGTLHERITRSLAYMLRHQPEEFDLELDAFGYADLSDVVHALNERLGEPIEDEDVREAIEAGDRPRYEIQDDAICALYGHSIAIDPGPPSEPPELLYVGVGSRDAARAEEYGLRGGRRTFLHLALTYDDAQETGRRIAPEYSVVTVRARDAWRDGVQFYDRHALFLSEEIATDYLEVGEIHDDGIIRERRLQRDRGGRDRGGRSRGGRDRERGRDRYDERPRREERDERPRREERDERPRREERDERPRREERDERPRRAERDERPRREAPADSRPARTEREPAASGSSGSSSSGSSSGFGLGILDPKPKKEKRERKPREKRVEKPRPEPESKPPEEPAADSAPEGGGFGSGIF